MKSYRVYQQYKSDVLFDQTFGYFMNQQDALREANKHIALNPEKPDSIIIEEVNILPSMNTYHKIQTVYLRNPDDGYKKLMEGVWSKLEFEYLQNAEWIFEEKIDGTNIRIMYDGENINIGGKTDEAQTPVSLLDAIWKLLSMDGPDRTASLDLWKSIFSSKDGEKVRVCLYGEGYGAGIQKGGGLYRKDKSFVLFDVKVGNVFLKRDAVADVASKLGLQIAPVVGRGTLHDAVKLVKEGFNSTWGPFLAEGIIARPAVELDNRFGERIITKIKHKDFT